MTTEARQIKVSELKEILKTDPNAQIIDVREAVEHAGERVGSSRNIPLSNLGQSRHEIDAARPIYLLCQRGGRAAQAAERLAKHGFDSLHIIEGGIEACKAGGLPVEKGASSVWAMDRQVRFAAGTMVLAGIILAWLVHPGFIGVSLFVSAGLIFSAVTDTCGMAMLLAKMPWNKTCGKCAK